MTANETYDAALTYEDLHDWVTDAEAQLAPGSETSIYGEYVSRIRELTGSHPSELVGGDAISIDEASWWVGYYQAIDTTLDAPDGVTLDEVMRREGYDQGIQRLQDADA